MIPATCKVYACSDGDREWRSGLVRIRLNQFSTRSRNMLVYSVHQPLFGSRRLFCSRPVILLC